MHACQLKLCNLSSDLSPPHQHLPEHRHQKPRFSFTHVNTNALLAGASTLLQYLRIKPVCSYIAWKQDSTACLAANALPAVNISTSQSPNATIICSSLRLTVVEALPLLDLPREHTLQVRKFKANAIQKPHNHDDWGHCTASVAACCNCSLQR
jgi:hypothetical protein